MFDIKCLKCKSTDFVYKSDSTGNARMYRCRACGESWLAIMKTMPCASVFSEKRNCERKDFDWVLVIR